MRRPVVVVAITLICSLSLSAQWPKYSEPGVPRDAQGGAQLNGPPPRTPDGKTDFTGDWLRADRDPPPPELSGILGGGGRNVAVEPAVQPFPASPNSPPLATFWDIGVNLPGGLQLTTWAAELKKNRMASNSKDNPDAN